MEAVRKLGRLSIADFLRILTIMLELRENISKFMVCLKDGKLVFIGDVEGELELKNPRLVELVRQFVSECRT